MPLGLRKAVGDTFWIDRYPREGAAPQARIQKDMRSFGMLPAIHEEGLLLTHSM